MGGYSNSRCLCPFKLNSYSFLLPLRRLIAGSSSIHVTSRELWSLKTAKPCVLLMWCTAMLECLQHPSCVCWDSIFLSMSVHCLVTPTKDGEHFQPNESHLKYTSAYKNNVMHTTPSPISPPPSQPARTLAGTQRNV